jgi:chemotaxis protein CheZ
MHRAGTSDKMLPCNSALIAAGYCSSPGQTGADVHRKVFRIEQMAGERRTPSAFVRAARTDGNDVQTLRRELSGVRETLAADMRALAGLLHEGKERRMARAAGELGAAVNAMETATDKILQSAEAMDDCAKALAAAPRSDYERGLAQDIQDHLVRIYEACNFQDLAGQRIGKVIATLVLIEQRIEDILDGKTVAATAGARTAAGGLLNGPKLDGDAGHANQRDIDALFS